MHKKVVKKAESRLQSDNNNNKSSTYSPSKMQPTLAAELTNCEADPLAARGRLKKPRALLDRFLCSDGENMSLPS